MTPVRLLLVELEPDDPGTRALARALRDEGAEVVYTTAGTAEAIAITAVQEDVRAVGFVIRTDDHRRTCAELAGHDAIVVFATTGDADCALPDTVFRAGSADQVVEWARKLT
jgi:methylmalonyl-CoA mutase cobalamin-binding domain/chain